MIEREPSRLWELPGQPWRAIFESIPSPIGTGRLAFALTLIALGCGGWVLVSWGTGPGAIVLGVSAVVGAALHWRCTTGGTVATAVSAALAGLFLAYAIAGFFSIAPFYLPAAVSLVLAVFLTPEGPSPERAPS